MCWVSRWAQNVTGTAMRGRRSNDESPRINVSSQS
jgi:hypothetical protein